MGLVDFSRMTALLLRISGGARDDQGRRQPSDKIIEQRGLTTTSRAVAYDLYAPRRRSPLGGIMAIHGVTMQGGRDQRLIHFARCLAHSGVACATPTLPGLAACRWAAEDLEILGQLVASFSAQLGGPVGLIGFSYGGGYALTLASNPEIGRHLRFVLSFGAYYDLGELFDWYLKHQYQPPNSKDQWDNVIYLRLVLAQQLGRRANLPEPVQDEVRSLLTRYCCEATMEEKQQFYQRWLRDRDLLDQAFGACDQRVLAELSPAGKLSTVACPVSLIHDSDDSLVPAEHSRRIYQELRRGEYSSGEHQLLITSLLSHVNLAAMLNLKQLRKLYRALGPMLKG